MAGRRWTYWAAAALGFALTVGCENAVPREPGVGQLHPQEQGKTVTRFSREHGLIEPHQRPVYAVPGETLTSSRIVPPKDTDPNSWTFIPDESSTAPHSANPAVRGSAASGVYLAREKPEAIGGAGGPKQLPPGTGVIDSEYSTVNPGRGSLPRRNGTGTGFLSAQPDPSSTGQLN